VVLFAHGSGSSRHSPRNRCVAEIIRDAGIGTLLFDLLTQPEEAEDEDTGQLRFNIPLLAQRLTAATRWLHSLPEAKSWKTGYFGASTGAAAALAAAAMPDNPVSAVVCRGGRPDLAGRSLDLITVPTLLIVGGLDDWVVRLNADAFAHLRGPKDFRVIPGAGHLFSETGKLEQVAQLAAHWFCKHLFPPLPPR
jgi:dienelactone hydrolase